MKEWFTLAELADLKLPDMPSSVSKVHEMAKRNGWKIGNRFRPMKRRGGGFEYHMSLLPRRAQVKLAVIMSRDEAREKRSRLWWDRWGAAKDEHRIIAQARLGVLVAVNEALAFHCQSETGLEKGIVIAATLRRYEISVSTYYAWQRTVEGVERGDWLPALLPNYGTPEFCTGERLAPIHPDALAAFIIDFKGPLRPSFSACYRRVLIAAEKYGWTPIPSERALRRRVGGMR